MELPEELSDKETFALDFNATATVAKMGVSFDTSLYTSVYIKIYASYEKYALNQRNGSHATLRMFALNCENEQLGRKSRT